MVNTKDFSSRLQKVIDFYDLSASLFAENIGVQRSSISHILSGRNKPSLDFIMKILAAYPDVELYWLLNGRGKFPLTKQKVEEKPLLSYNKSTTDDLFSTTNASIDIENSFDPLNDIKKTETSKKAIERIVIFYKDGSFSNYENS